MRAPGAREIEQYSGLVRSIAWQVHRTAPASVEIDDLVAFGFLGLIQAAERFDPDHGAQFSTFAYPRIRGAMLNGMAKMSSHSARERPPEDPPPEGGEPLAAGRVPGIRSMEPVSPVAQLSAAEARARLAMLVGEMPDQMRELIRLVYVAGMTLKDAGEQLSLSKSWTSRVHARALDHLVTLMRREGIVGPDRD